MRFKNLEKLLKKKLPDTPYYQETVRDEILDAVKKDIEAGLGSKDDVAEIIPMCNEIFGKRYRVMPKNVVNRYREILKHFSLDDVRKAMENARDNDFHKENGHTYCTPEYFSRIVQVEKWLNASPGKKTSSSFVPISVRNGKQ
jgi:hypothetical protein